MNAYLRIGSCTATEKLIADCIQQVSATANIHFSKKTGFSDLKMNIAQSTKEEKPQEVEWSSF